jgi:outer membrane lipoprotein-sorting protein
MRSASREAISPATPHASPKRVAAFPRNATLAAVMVTLTVTLLGGGQTAFASDAGNATATTAVQSGASAASATTAVPEASVVPVGAAPSTTSAASSGSGPSRTSTTAPASANAAHGPLTIDTLLHAFAQRKSGDARFTELKYLSNLKGPVESSGTLSFRAPDHFEQQTVKPRAQSLVVDGDTVTMSRDGRQRVVSLSQYPEIGTLIDSIRGTLTGDRASLERSYKLALDGTAATWHLTLTPIDASLSRTIDHIVVSGGEDASGAAQIRTIETFQADGDRSVMTLETGQT